MSSVTVTLTPEQMKRFERSATAWPEPATLELFVSRAVEWYLPQFERAAHHARAARAEEDRHALRMKNPPRYIGASS